MDPGATTRAAPLVAGIHKLVDHLGYDFLGGPRPLKMAWVINFQKALTFAWVLGLMAVYGNTSTAAWVYLGLHGSYGFCWLVKHAAFPDASWERRVTIGGAVMSFLLVLGPYWVLPWLLISRGASGASPPPSDPRLALAIAVHTLGVAVMLSADAQKHFVLRARRGLVSNGMYARTRHPNYLGEMLIYGAYALVVGHWLGWAILGWVWTVIFLVNMLMQEASLGRYPEWPAYRARTGFLLPRVF